MMTSDYNASNEAKASFDEAYGAPTPHEYLANMNAVGYRLAERMQPFLATVVDASRPADAPIRVLDVGCSYGISAALLKTACSYGELSAFYGGEASREFEGCVRDTQQWLRAHAVREDVEVVGLDCSDAAIRFATAADLLDRGIARNLEVPSMALEASERRSVAECDVLFSAGTVGYVSDRTMHPILSELGAQGHGALGPVAVLSVLELFEPEPIAEAFEAHEFRFGALAYRVPQRQFADETERARVIETLQKRGLTTKQQEVENQMFATLCVAARPEHFDTLATRVAETAAALPPSAVKAQPS